MYVLRVLGLFSDCVPLLKTTYSSALTGSSVCPTPVLVVSSTNRETDVSPI